MAVYDDPGRYHMCREPLREHDLWYKDHENHIVHQLQFREGILVTCRIVKAMPVFFWPDE